MRGRVASGLSGLLFLAGIALFGAAILSGPEPALAATVDISITDNGFSPQSITVPPGTTVTWTNNSGSTQTVNSTLSGVDPNFFASPFLYGGQSWSHTFSSTGTFNYKSVTTNILGSVVVDASAGTPPTPTPTPTTAGGGGGGGASVSITDGGFVPQSISVAVGATVTWTNNSGSTQTVNAMLSGVDPNFFASPFIYTGQSWSHTFSSAGTFNYKSVTSNLTGTVIVGGGGGGSPTNTPVPTPTKTPVPTATNTPPPGISPTSVAGATSTPTPTRTPAPGPGATNTVTPTRTATPTNTPTSTPGAKSTSTPTKTPTTGSGGGSGPFGTLSAGWNLVTYGGPSGGPGQALFQLGSQWTAAYYWDGHEWHRFFRPGAAPAYLNNMGRLEPGQALWILATGAIP